jgi:hypothetical protein
VTTCPQPAFGSAPSSADGALPLVCLQGTWRIRNEDATWAAVHEHLARWGIARKADLTGGST